jgi:hypothetical protein
VGDAHLDEAGTVVGAMKILLAAGIVIAAISIAACGGQSAQDKAKSQVCSAKSEITKQLDYLSGLTITTATKSGIQNSVKTITDSLSKMKDAAPKLSSGLRSDVEGATEKFSSQVQSVVGEIGSNLSISQAATQLSSAVKQLSADFKQSFTSLSCS